MKVEDLYVEPDGERYFLEDPERDAYLVAWVDDDGDIRYVCAVNPSRPDQPGALHWCARLITRIEEHGFDRAMEMDAWQHRKDGKWQGYCRSVWLPDF